MLWQVRDFLGVGRARLRYLFVHLPEDKVRPSSQLVH